MTTILTYNIADFIIGNGVNKYLLSQQINNIPSFPTSVKSISVISNLYVIYFVSSIGAFESNVNAIVAAHDPDTQFDNEPGTEAIYTSNFDTTPKFLLSTTGPMGKTGAFTNAGNIHFNYANPGITGNFEEIRSDIGLTGVTGDVISYNNGMWEAISVTDLRDRQGVTIDNSTYATASTTFTLVDGMTLTTNNVQNLDYLILFNFELFTSNSNTVCELDIQVNGVMLVQKQSGAISKDLLSTFIGYATDVGNGLTVEIFGRRSEGSGTVEIRRRSLLIMGS